MLCGPPSRRRYPAGSPFGGILGPLGGPFGLLGESQTPRDRIALLLELDPRVVLGHLLRDVAAHGARDLTACGLPHEVVHRVTEAVRCDVALDASGDPGEPHGLSGRWSVDQLPHG